MDAVVSLLDGEHAAIVAGIWRELEEKFGVRGVAATPFPHFSYQIADCYAIERVEEALERIAAATPRITVRTGGLGIFTGEEPILYVPVVRSPELTRLHCALWEELAGAGSEVPPTYAPDSWTPHITLGHGDIDAGNLPEIIALLAGRNFRWELPVDNLAVIYRVDAKQGLHARYPLRDTD